MDVVVTSRKDTGPRVTPWAAGSVPGAILGCASEASWMSTGNAGHRACSAGVPPAWFIITAVIRLILPIESPPVLNGYFSTTHLIPHRPYTGIGRRFHENVPVVSLYRYSGHRACWSVCAFHRLYLIFPAGRTSSGHFICPLQSPAPVSTSAPVGTEVSASLPYGVTLSVPADWTREDVLTSGTRDYGTTTLNIANFYSPDTIPGDRESYISLSVDLDRTPGADFEKYFNSATLAVGTAYGVPLLTGARSYTITIAGYKSYDWISRTQR